MSHIDRCDICNRVATGNATKASIANDEVKELRKSINSLLIRMSFGGSLYSVGEEYLRNAVIDYLTPKTHASWCAKFQPADCNCGGVQS